MQQTLLPSHLEGRRGAVMESMERLTGIWLFDIPKRLQVLKGCSEFGVFAQNIPWSDDGDIQGLL